MAHTVHLRIAPLLVGLAVGVLPLVAGVRKPRPALQERANTTTTHGRAGEDAKPN
jgi:hypothetical protein